MAVAHPAASASHDPPQSILLDGKPHIGTDRLVRLLRQFRGALGALGVDVRFGSCVDGLCVKGGRVTGVRVQGVCGGTCWGVGMLITCVYVCICTRVCMCATPYAIHMPHTCTPKNTCTQNKHTKRLLQGVRWWLHPQWCWQLGTVLAACTAT